MTSAVDGPGPYVLGIDFGTESCRAAVIDARGQVAGVASSGYATTHIRPGWATQSPDDWWSALCAATAHVMGTTGLAGDQIAGIGYAATTMTVVPMTASGEHLDDAILWMDVRAVEQAGRAASSTSVALRYIGDGAAPASAEWFPFKAAWLAENHRDLFDHADYLVDAADWLTHQLTGAWTQNINSAALRMFHNRDEGGWPTDFYAHVGAAEALAKVPERVVDLGTRVGSLTADAAHALGLRAGTPIAQGCGDAWAGQIGLNALRPGRMALITGSSHVLTGQSATPISGPGFFGAYTDAVLPGQYTVEGGQVSTGSVLKWFVENFARDVSAEAERRAADGTSACSPYELLNERSRHLPPGAEGLVMNEYFQGNRTPYTDGQARGILWGMSLRHTREHLYRAIQEAVCYGTEHNLRTMRQAGLDVTTLVACGGVTKSRDWIQMHADVTGVPIELTEVGDAVVLGAGILAATAAGLYPSVSEAAEAMVHTAVVLDPDPARHEAYRPYVDAYIETYPLLRDPIHRMQDHLA
ncbi:FGGY-family carbohydrate kinase [Ruania halotolerans]|uniref:FGGY-family carbohydrate kinase n=1 Tax=Ruania halotolerans TaxID=2897773 RepID=UPI001E4C03F8|nr:FGGY-family carbohydrate kinase [Ruania halotolerans]UFU06911.1 xylulose kinase [Ruania halotolerans]